MARDGSEASFRPDGSCCLSNEADGTETVWASVALWASQWLDEWRTRDHGDACDFIGAARDDAVAGVVGALVVLAETATSGDELAWVGAGPLEDLVSHSDNGLRLLADVDRAARQHAAFRAALSNTWLGRNVPAPVRDRLGVLGARVLRS